MATAKVKKSNLFRDYTKHPQTWRDFPRIPTLGSKKIWDVRTICEKSCKRRRNIIHDFGLDFILP